MESIASGTLKFLEVLRLNLDATQPSSFSVDWQARSASVDTQQKNRPNETNCLPIPEAPMRSPKATAFWQVANYREAYGIFSCPARVFCQHGSHRSGPSQLGETAKIIERSTKHQAGDSHELRLGNSNIWCANPGVGPPEVCAGHATDAPGPQSPKD